MRKKSAFLLTLALAGTATSASAQASLVLNPKQGSSEKKEFLLDGIRTLTFGDDGLTVNLKDGQTYAAAFDNLATLTFRDESTAIETVTAEYAANLDLFLTDGRLGVNNLPANVATEAALYDAAGRAVLMRRQWNGEPIAIGHLPKGVYIFKVNNQTLKFTR
ncbi:MAG: T9SS type A sorting domain-containing protein [Bacteroidales bacterium]|nr:T9SS type A sorting domain-containing protein [Bacteroidales bacterium]